MFDSHHLLQIICLYVHLLYTHPNDKVITDSGTIECVDGDDFSPTWYVSELQLLGDEFLFACCCKVFIRILRPGTEGQQHTHKVAHNGTLTTRGRKPDQVTKIFSVSNTFLFRVATISLVV